MPWYLQYATLTKHYFENHSEDVAQRKLVEDPDIRYLRALIWCLKCQGEFAAGKIDKLPKNDDGTTYVPPLPERCDFQSISIVTNAERKEWRTKQEELQRKGMPDTPDKIREAIEEEKGKQEGQGRKGPRPC